MNPNLLNSLCYTIGWFVCVLSGIHGYPILGVIGAIILIAFQLYNAKQIDVGLYIQDLLMVSFSVPLGIVLELFFMHAGIIDYFASSIFPPIWIIFLYPLFSLLLNHSLKMLRGSYLLPFLFGFFGAPLSYLAGLSLGGLTFTYPMVLTWIILGISWGLFLCLLVKVANIIEKATLETLEERDSKNTLELLFDGDCPLCTREVCLLQSKTQHWGIIFIDIASKQYLPEEHKDIGFDTAMSQMHAVDSKGKVLVGLPAFAAVYAHCNLLVASTLFRIPFIAFFLNPLYRIFAKNRLWITGRAAHEKN